jgi:hypothetical protein
VDAVERRKIGPFSTRGSTAPYLPAGLIMAAAAVLAILGIFSYSVFGPPLQCASEKGTAYWLSSLLAASLCCLIAPCVVDRRRRWVAIVLGGLVGSALGMAVAHLMFMPQC